MNARLIGGLALLALLALGDRGGLAMFVDLADAAPLSADVVQPPSAEYPFGTDSAGRNLLAVMVHGHAC